MPIWAANGAPLLFLLGGLLCVQAELVLAFRNPAGSVTPGAKLGGVQEGESPLLSCSGKALTFIFFVFSSLPCLPREVSTHTQTAWWQSLLT